MAVSDAALRGILEGRCGIGERAIREIARELLAARRVCEAAQSVSICLGTDWVQPEHPIARLRAALAEWEASRGGE